MNYFPIIFNTDPTSIPTKKQYTEEKILTSDLTLINNLSVPSKPSKPYQDINGKKQRLYT